MPEKATEKAETAQILHEFYDKGRKRAIPAKIYHPAVIKTPRPVIIFSHGMGATRHHYQYLGTCWAQNGFISIHIQHKGSDDEIFQSEKPPIKAMLASAKSRTDTYNRPADVSFVIDCLTNGDHPLPSRALNTDLIAVAGHSFGAQTALAIAGMTFSDFGPSRNFHDPRVKTIIQISAPLPHNRDDFAAAYDSVALPCLHITGTRDDSPIGLVKADQRRIPFDYIQTAPQVLMIFDKANHMVFADLPRKRPSRRQEQLKNAVALATTCWLRAMLNSDKQALADIQQGSLGRLPAPTVCLQVKL